jgi:hypothetical protein
MQVQQEQFSQERQEILENSGMGMDYDLFLSLSTDKLEVIQQGTREKRVMNKKPAISTEKGIRSSDIIYENRA